MDLILFVDKTEPKLPLSQICQCTFIRRLLLSTLRNLVHFCFLYPVVDEWVAIQIPKYLLGMASL